MPKLAICIICFLCTGCFIVNQPVYSYVYKDLKTGVYGGGQDYEYYLPGDTIVMFPSGTELLIVSREIN